MRYLHVPSTLGKHDRDSIALQVGNFRFDENQEGYSWVYVIMIPRTAVMVVGKVCMGLL